MVLVSAVIFTEIFVQMVYSIQNTFMSFKNFKQKPNLNFLIILRLLVVSTEKIWP